MRIAGGRGLKTGRRVLEDHPSELLHLGLVKVMDRTPVAENPPYVGPTGTAAWGGLAVVDAGGEWRQDGSAWSGAVIGAPGSGRSRTVESIAIGAMWSGLAGGAR